MNIFKRIRNLWRQSEFEVDTPITNPKTKWAGIIGNTSQQATIVEPDLIEQLTEELK